MLEFRKNKKKKEGSQMRILSIQIALFFKEFQSRPDKYIAKIENHFDDMFDNMPVIRPIPHEAPGDIPVVILSSSKQKVKINISKTRMDFFIDMDETEAISEAISKNKQLLQKYIEFAKKELDVIRMGIIANTFIEDNNAIETLKKKYFAVKMDNLNEISIRYNQLSKLKKMRINNLYNFESVTAQINGKDVDGIVLNIDINNQVVNENLRINGNIAELLEYALGRFREERIREVI